MAHFFRCPPTPTSSPFAFLCVVVALSVGCATKTAPAAKTGDVIEAASRSKSPWKAITWQQGPETRDAGTLVDWLEANAREEDGGRRLFRLPVAVSFDEPYRFGFRAAFLGDPEQTRLELDDGALGIPLRDRLTQLCPRAQSRCAVWLDGHWGALIEAASDPHDNLPVFAVRNVGDLVGALKANGLHAFVEAPDRATETTTEWPFTAWESARAFTYNFVAMNRHDQMTVFKGTHRNPKVRSSHPLMQAQARDVVERVHALRGTLMVSKCPFPRHAVVFFSSSGKPVGEIDVCFECGDVIAWPDYPLTFEERYRVDPQTDELLAWPAYDALTSHFKRLFDDLGEPIDWKKD